MKRLILIGCLLVSNYCFAQHIDSVNDVMSTWDIDRIDNFCDSLQMGKNIQAFNGLNDGVVDPSTGATRFTTDDYNYLGKGKIANIQLYFKDDILVGKLYIFNNPADYTLACSSIIMSLKALPLRASKEMPYDVIESNRYIIKLYLQDNKIQGAVYILNKKYFN